MPGMRALYLATASLLAAAMLASGGCGGGSSNDKTLNVYSWANYIAPDTIANFERETGIKVNYSIFDTNEVLETKLLTGHTNYDVVVPTDVFFERLLKAGVFRKLDKTALPNNVNLDPEFMRTLALHDPGNLYGVPYLWTTTGFGYNVDMIHERLGPGEFDSWSLLFDPKNAAKLKDCGIVIIDSPSDVLFSVLIYLGKDPNSLNPVDLAAAFDTLAKIRPFVRSIEAIGIIDDLANGNFCLALTWSGDVNQARYRALEAGNGVKIRSVMPREGALISIDMIGIPADAPHPQNAEIWLNYLMRPEVIAGISNSVKYPNGNKASLRFIQDVVKNDAAIYPSAETRAKLHPLVAVPPEHSRLVTRLWTQFRTGQ